MDKAMKHMNTRPLFAFTAASGTFPGAPDTNSFWEKIVKAETTHLTSLESRWGLKRDLYYDPNPGIPDKIYLDKAFCLPEKEDNSGRQIRYGQEVLKKLSDKLLNGEFPPSFAETALVAGTSWSDQGYYINDIDFWFNKKDGFDKRFSPDEQLKDLADCIGIGGPSIAVDTACASSLYAVETAVNLIRSGQARSAVILGLSVVIPPFLMSAFSQLMALSPEGKSLPFSKDASGMVPGEAAAAVFLEPLEDAIASGRQIMGILRSTGLSSDGSEGSVFAPGAGGQQHAYERAYKNIDPSGVDYVEAHGTATALGDKTELQGIKSFFGPHFKDGKKLYIGSVKSLTGHSLAAAGMCSLIKALFILMKKTIPPHIDVEPNPEMGNSCIALAENAIPLDTLDRPVRIGVSSFGFGGSNVHIVLESYDKKKHRPCENNESGESLFPDIAIVDFETGFGDKLSASERVSGFYENSDVGNFPDKRFCRKANRNVIGKFFPDKITIDAKGLRLGPRFLSRIDAFQNHAVNLVSNIIKRNSDVKNSDYAAVLMSNNIGSSKTFKMTRKYYAGYFLDSDSVACENLPDTTLEDIASGLGSMFSGYPCYHFNLKGFHQTCSGGTSSFWTTLLTAPFMLKNHCKELIAGAGNFIKTPVDLFDKRIDSEHEISVWEGTAAFLLKSRTQAEQSEDRVLAIISAIVPSAMADTFEKACRIAGVDPNQVDIREFSQLKSASGYKQETGRRFLGEATGCEVLTSVLMKDGNQASVEVYNDKNLLFTVFIKKTAKFAGTKSKIAMPVTTTLSDETVYLKENDQAIEPIPVNYETGGIDSAEIFSIWHETTASAVQSFLKSQKTAAMVKGGIESFQKTDTTMDRDLKELSVLRNITRRVKMDDSKTDETLFSAELVVDESHPYFFDHPLDHIPGILILQGGLELFDIGVKQVCTSEMFISSIDIEFKQMCEKSMPVYIHSSIAMNTSGKPFECICEAVQNDNVAAIIRIKPQAFVRKESGDKKDIKKPVPYPDPAILHKQESENILVSDYKKEGDEYYFDLIPPPKGHFLNCDGREFYSMLYILEITRQCGMILVHKVGEIPLKTPMILLSLKFRFQRPASCSQPLRISHTPSSESITGRTIMGTMDFILHDENGAFGESSISTLIVK